MALASGNTPLRIPFMCTLTTCPGPDTVTRDDGDAAATSGLPRLSAPAAVAAAPSLSISRRSIVNVLFFLGQLISISRGFREMSFAWR